MYCGSASGGVSRIHADSREGGLGRPQGHSDRPSHRSPVDRVVASALPPDGRLRTRAAPRASGLGIRRGTDWPTVASKVRPRHAATGRALLQPAALLVEAKRRVRREWHQGACGCGAAETIARERKSRRGIVHHHRSVADDEVAFGGRRSFQFMSWTAPGESRRRRHALSTSQVSTPGGPAPGRARDAARRRLSEFTSFWRVIGYPGSRRYPIASSSVTDWRPRSRRLARRRRSARAATWSSGRHYGSNALWREAGASRRAGRNTHSMLPTSGTSPLVTASAREGQPHRD
jgi:hypothetical protein